jgi:formylglycine-generating enzyme
MRRLVSKVGGGRPLCLIVGLLASLVVAPDARAQERPRAKRSIAVPARSAGEATLTNSIGMTFRLIPAGEFTMGSPDNDHEAAAFERPQHRVRITKPFYLGVHEVTLGQFRRFVDATGYRTDVERVGAGGYGWNDETKEYERNSRYTWKNVGFEQSDQHPILNVTWYDAVAMAKWLSQKEGKTYRLPTEAEWEYACRAGTTTRYSCGDDPEGLASVANVGDATLKAEVPGWPFATIAARDGFVFTAPIGSFKANPWGLHDMHGNAWEWCADSFDEDFYKRSPVDDPENRAAASNGSRVIRGGGAQGSARPARSADRVQNGPHDCYSNLGFRLVRVQAGD